MLRNLPILYKIPFDFATLDTIDLMWLLNFNLLSEFIRVQRFSFPFFFRRSIRRYFQHQCKIYFFIPPTYKIGTLREWPFIEHWSELITRKVWSVGKKYEGVNISEISNGFHCKVLHSYKSWIFVDRVEFCT